MSNHGKEPSGDAVDSLTLAVLLAIALSGAGCVTSRAQIPEQPPTLVVPPVPPRAIEPPVIVEPPVEPPPVEPPPAPVATSKPPRPRPAADKPEPKAGAPARFGGDRADTAAGGAAAVGGHAERSGSDAPDPRDPRHHAEDAGQGGPGVARERRSQGELRVRPRRFLRQAEEALKKEELTQARLVCGAGAEYRQATAVGPLGPLLGGYTPTK